VSTFHAFVKEQDGRFYLQDGGSKNGTLVDGEPAAEREARQGTLLHPGVTILIGEVELIFLDAPGLCTLAKKVVKAQAQPARP
jgi:predicted component of type VI protein secretion system